MVAYSGLYNGVYGENYALQVGRNSLNKKLSRILKRRGVTRLNKVIDSVVQGLAMNTGAPVLLGADPFAVEDTKSVVTVTHTAHGLSSGDVVVVSGATGGFNIVAPDLNRAHVITVTGANTYTFTVAGVADDDDDIGGSAVTVAVAEAAGYARVASTAAPGNPAVNGGLRVIEQIVKVPAGSTVTAADVAVVDDITDFEPQPEPYPDDLGGNGGGGKLAHVQ